MAKNQKKFQFTEVDRLEIVQLAKKSLRSREGKPALDYLKNERKFSDKIIDKFDIGYCPERVDHELKGRILTPIYDVYNELIAISSRHLNRNHPQRFLHESFDKGSYLYGLCYAKDSIIYYKKAILVEGEFDVAALHTVGFSYTVGVCGSAFTVSQAALLARYCSNIYVMFDGDESGKRAIQRVMKMYDKYNFKSYKLNLVPVYLPKNKDPDECVRENKNELKQILVNAKEEYEVFGNK